MALWQSAFEQMDNLVRVRVQNNKTEAPANTASVMCTILDAGGNQIAGASQFMLDYVADSDGLYEGNMDETVALVDRTAYMAKIIGQEGSLGLKMKVPFVGYTNQGRPPSQTETESILKEAGLIR